MSEASKRWQWHQTQNNPPPSIVVGTKADTYAIGNRDDCMRWLLCNHALFVRVYMEARERGMDEADAEFCAFYAVAVAFANQGGPQL